MVRRLSVVSSGLADSDFRHWNNVSAFEVQVSILASTTPRNDRPEQPSEK